MGTFTWRAGPPPKKRRSVEPERHIVMRSGRRTRTEDDKLVQARHLLKVRLTQQLLEHVVPSGSFLGPLQCGNSDPFFSTPVGLTAVNHDLINRWRLLFIHLVWPKAPDIEYLPVISAWQSMMRMAFSNEACMHALLACVTFWKIASTDNDKDYGSLIVKGLGHESAGLSALRSELARDSQSRLVQICTIYLLASAAIKADFPDKATVHLEALRRLIDEYGGLMSLPFSIRGAINHVDIAASAGSCRPLVFSQQLWDKGNIMADLSLPETLLVRRSHYLKESISGEVPIGTHHVFSAYRDLMAVHTMAPQLQDQSRRTHLLCWTQSRAFAQIGETRDVKAALASFADLEVPGAADLASEVVARTALTYMADMLFYTKHAYATVLIDYYDIQKLLDHAEVRALVSEAFLLWCLATGSAVEYNFYKKGKTRWWHAPRFLLLARHMGVDSVDLVAPVLSQFLYNETPISRYLEAIFVLDDFILNTTGCDVEEVTRIPAARARRERSDYIWRIPKTKAWDNSWKELQRGNIIQWTAPSSDYVELHL